MINLTFLGATSQITGSCYLLETSKHRILLDCGLFQGSKETELQNDTDFPFDPAHIDVVVLSHAHLDHCGRLPKLVQGGFKGPVFLTEASFPLLALMLRDAAHLQRKDIEWENKHRERAGKTLLEPHYDLEDVEALLMLRAPVAYNTPLEIQQGINLIFHEAGHILGSAIVHLQITDQTETKTLVFSGDLGNCQSPLLRNAETITTADVLLLESTYGDRDHKPLKNTLIELRDILANAHKNGGNVIMPTFAIGRTQDLIYWLGKLQRQGQLPQQHIFLDSSMAISASKIYAQHTDLFNIDDPEFIEIAPQGWQNWLRGLIYSETIEDSMSINQLTSDAIIIADSGMCNGGRIRHHLKYNLWRRNAHIVITGFQAQGTLGRTLIDNNKKSIKILDAEVNIAAKIHTLGALSNHADQSQLLQWAGNFNKPTPRLYLVHGEKTSGLSLQACFNRQGWQANVPDMGDKITI